MKSKLILLILSLCIGINTAKADDGMFFIKDVPDSLCIGLNIAQRAALFSLQSEGKYDTLTNRFGGHSWIEQWEKERNYLRIHYNEVEEWEILKLDNIIVWIRTYCAPICHSSVQTYDLNWIKIGNISSEKNSSFVSAHFDGDQVKWTDNSDKMRDSTEIIETK